MISFDLEPAATQIAQKPKITVVGVGGAGGNIINSIHGEDIKNINFIAINTDIQSLQSVHAHQKIQIGINTAEGMGTGANQEIGRMAAEEDLPAVMEALSDSDIVFLIAGLGGGTGTGALIPIGKALQEKHILTIAIVTKPFIFEGNKRMQVAQGALQRIEEYIDTLIVIPNQKLFESNDTEITLLDAFASVNKTISDCIRAVSDTIHSHGYINVDFADIKATMTRMGKSVIGIGKSSGDLRAKKAIEKAIASPLLEYNNFKGAKSILLNIHADSTLSLHEVSVITGYINEQVHPEANIIVGTTIDERSVEIDKENSEVTVTLIATGFEDQLRSRVFGGKQYQNQQVMQHGHGSSNVQRGNYYHHHFTAANATQVGGNQAMGPSQDQSHKNSGAIDIPAYLRKNLQQEESIS